MTIALKTPTATKSFEETEAGRVVAAPDSDQALLKSLCKGEDHGYEALVRACGPQVLAVARRYLRSEADAADCFQETFIAVFNSIDSYTGQSPLRQWVRGVAVNQCLMALRKRKRTREESIEHMMPQFDELGSRIQSAGEHRQPAVEALLDERALQKAVRHAIDGLPEDYRVILLLRDIDGYSTREAATILGIQVNAAKTRLHRARTALRHILQPILEQEDHDVDV